MRPTIRIEPALALALAVGCATATVAPEPSRAGAATPGAGALRVLALPGAPAEGGVSLDLIAYDRTRRRVWVPAGGTGSVDVIDVPSEQVHRVEGFPVKEAERNGKKRLMGPSSAAAGGARAFVGNRADATVCAVDAQTLEKGPCLALDSAPDGLQYVASRAEVWATTPRDRSIRVLDVSGAAPVEKARIAVDGEPECYAVDEAHGLFFTNLEDADRTLAIDLATRQVVHTWNPACGGEGPRGVVFAAEQQVLVVACTDRLVALDLARDGAVAATLPVGAGIDNIDYVPARREVYASAGKDARLVVATVGAGGTLALKATIPVRAGARTVVATDEGTAYLIDPQEGAILAVDTAR